MYKNLIKNINNIKASLQIDFIQGPKVEIKSPIPAEYLVEFYDSSTNKLIHSSIIKNNHWTKCLYQYYIPWHIKAYQKENDKWIKVEDSIYNLKDKHVYISIDSKALGDTLAWFPYIDEFRKKHDCKITCSTFNNHFFEKQYPEIKFINPGSPVHGIYAMYNIGWYYNNDVIDPFKHPYDIKSQPMQKTASDILGLEFKEIKPKINKSPRIKKKQVSIAIHATAQCKYWNNPTGWQEVVDWCKSLGYDVVLLSREGDGYMGNIHPKGIKYLNSYDIDNVIKTLYESELFIGLSSGISWLSWVTDTPTIIVSGFSESYTEPSSCYYAKTPEGKCKGCFNTHKLDPGDWNWCPIHKETDRQFECSKSISAKSVIDIINTIVPSY